MRHFDRLLNLDNCQPEVVSEVISGMADQDVGMDLCTNLADSRLKPSDVSFPALFRTSITSDRKHILTPMNNGQEQWNALEWEKPTKEEKDFQNSHTGTK